jgi:hypothetical protein
MAWFGKTSKSKTDQIGEQMQIQVFSGLDMLKQVQPCAPNDG